MSSQICNSLLQTLRGTNIITNSLSEPLLASYIKSFFCFLTYQRLKREIASDPYRRLKLILVSENGMMCPAKSTGPSTAPHFALKHPLLCFQINNSTMNAALHANYVTCLIVRPIKMQITGDKSLKRGGSSSVYLSYIPRTL